MKKTKIICTIGPACCNEETLTKMIEAGMNVARINFSHGTHDDHKKTIELIKSVREKLNAPVPIMLDTKGPEYRIGTFAGNNSVVVADGATFAFTYEDIEGDNTRVSVSYKNLINELEVGDTILVNDGLVIFKVKELTKTDVICEVVVGGELSNRKSMSFPNKVLKQDYLSEYDKEDLLFGIKMGVDFVACSFVSSKQDVLDVREFMAKHGGDDIDLIAKIENRSGVDNIEEIIDCSDGIMVARGDMGVEIPFEELPSIQKNLITTCRIKGKRVITATEMLESMINKPRPTRAEISDVANAVFDGTSAIMLSGETAMGKYPVQTVKTMSRIAEDAENHTDYASLYYRSGFVIKNDVDAISHSTCSLALDLKAKLIVVCSRTGSTARMVSRFRSPTPILGFTTQERVWRKLALSWGVIPALGPEFPSTEVLFYHAAEAAMKTDLVNKGDNIIITGGDTNGKSGNTNLIKVQTM